MDHKKGGKYLYSFPLLYVYFLQSTEKFSLKQIYRQWTETEDTKKVILCSFLDNFSCNDSFSKKNFLSF